MMSLHFEEVAAEMLQCNARWRGLGKGLSVDFVPLFTFVHFSLL